MLSSRRLASGSLSCLILAATVSIAAAQEASPGDREALGRIIGVGVVLASGDFIGGGTFDIKDEGGGTLKIQHLPWHHRFGEPSRRYQPWGTGSVGRVTSRQPIQLVEGPPDLARFVAESLAAVVGMEIGLGSGKWYLEPSVGLIYSWIESSLDYRSDASEAFRPVLDGVFFNWEAKAVTLAAAARLGYRTEWANKFAIDVAGQMVGLWTDPVSSTSPVQNSSSHSSCSRLQARLRSPLGLSTEDSGLFLIPRATYTAFSEEIEEPLDSSSMSELNLRLLAEIGGASNDETGWRRLKPEAMGLSVGYTSAAGFEGWTFGITFHSWFFGW